MFKESDLHSYQNHAIDFAMKTKKCGLFLDMGLGKTATSLTVAHRLIDNYDVTHVLVIAPLRVCKDTWPTEIDQWEHLKDLKISLAVGSAKERIKALKTNDEIHIINKENILWMVENVPWKWDMVIIDESSSFKSNRTKRFRALKKKLDQITRVIILTGTPSPNSLMDLWSQIYLLDNGKRLGRTITNFRRRFFTQTGYGGYKYIIKEGADEEIQELVKDICITMDSDDYIELPERIDLYEQLEFNTDIRKIYKEISKEFYLQLEDGVEIEAPSSATLINKQLQICNGAIYDADKNTHELHDIKINAIKEIMEDNSNETFLVAYNYKSDLKRLKKVFPEGVILSEDDNSIKDWNAGKIKILFVHPASAGHGLNIQYGGCVLIWFGLTWSLENYIQLNKRLHRPGQTKPVRIIHLIIKKSVESRVLKALKSKAKTQDEFMEYLKVLLLEEPC